MTAPLARRRQASSADFTNEEIEAATAEVEANVNSAQIDINDLLNPYSAKTGPEVYAQDSNDYGPTYWCLS